jgi:hypothetical protein
MIYKCVLLNKVFLSKTMFENEFQILFYKVFSLISKGYFSNQISILHYANKTLFWPIYKVLLEN